MNFLVIHHIVLSFSLEHWRCRSLESQKQVEWLVIARHYHWPLKLLAQRSLVMVWRNFKLVTCLVWKHLCFKALSSKLAVLAGLAVVVRWRTIVICLKDRTCFSAVEVNLVSWLANALKRCHTAAIPKDWRLCAIFHFSFGHLHWDNREPPRVVQVLHPFIVACSLRPRGAIIALRSHPDSLVKGFLELPTFHLFASNNFVLFYYGFMELINLLFLLIIFVKKILHFIISAA